MRMLYAYYTTHSPCYLRSCDASHSQGVTHPPVLKSLKFSKYHKIYLICGCFSGTVSRPNLTTTTMSCIAVASPDNGEQTVANAESAETRGTVNR